jgi:hypothetical protein
MSVRVSPSFKASLPPHDDESRRSLRDVLACEPPRGAPQIGHHPTDTRGAIAVVLPSGPRQGATLHISLDLDNPTTLTADEVMPFRLSPKFLGDRVPSDAGLAPGYLFDARYVAHNHYTLAAIPRPRDNRPRHASRPMEAVRPTNAVRPLIAVHRRPAPFTETAAPAEPTDDSTLFASGHMTSVDGPAAHTVTLYPRVGPGDPESTSPLATLVYDHPGNDAAAVALYFEATIDGRMYKANVNVGKGVGEFDKITKEIEASARARSVFWRMFFYVYSRLGSTYVVERAQKDVLTAVLDTYK